MSQGLELENRADVVVVSEDVSYSIAICAPQILQHVKNHIIAIRAIMPTALDS